MTKGLLLFAFIAAIMMVSCKNDETNIQEKNSTWILNYVQHSNDYVYGTGRWLVARETKDGKISEATITFFGSALPTQEGSYQVVRNPTRSDELSISCFYGSHTDSVWYSAGTDTNMATVTLVRGKLNVLVNNAKMIIPQDTSRSLRFSCNLKQR